MKEQIKTPDRKGPKRRGHGPHIRYRVQNTANQDAYRNDYVLLQNEGRNEGYTK